MENYNVYEDIATRTQGALYIGVVGPVRTGKSTFIKRFSQELVIPAAAGEKRLVMQDELPLSADGKTITTIEPKFVPAQPVEIPFGENTTAKIRLIDCVGYLVDGAMGFEEDGKQRLVHTPWQETPLPFEEAAKMGTQKVIRDHSTVAVLVTTDGSITDIPRENYVKAEEQTVAELKTLGKPFVMILNCKKPRTSSAQNLRAELEGKYLCPVLAVNVEEVDKEGLSAVLKSLLFEFPVTGIDVNIPNWMRSLPAENSLIGEIAEKLRAVAPKIEKMRDCNLLENAFTDSEKLSGVVGMGLNLSKGRAECLLAVKDDVFYQVISEECGESIKGDFDLLRYVKSLAGSKRDFDKVGAAFKNAQEYGYGVVTATENDICLAEPKLTKQGQNFGVKLTATAPTYHILKVDVTSSVNPIVGGKEQSEEFVKELLSDYECDDEKLWNRELFGKTIRELVGGGLERKSEGLNDNLQRKMRKAISRVVNFGRGNILCILI